MANTVRIKRRGSGALGAPAALANAELAFNEVGDGVLYYGKGTGGAGGTATSVIAIGGSGAFVDLSGVQTISGNKTFTGTLDLSSASISSLSTTGNVTVGGNLTVNGTTTTINSTTVSVDDLTLELGATASPTDAGANGGGIVLKASTDKSFLWYDATDSWTSNQNIEIAAGFAFRIDGSNVLTKTGLGSGVLSSSLTSVGTLVSGTWNATTIGVPYGGTGATTLTGYVKGAGTTALTASATVPHTDITGLGTLSTQNANNVAITGGTIDGITIDGGTY
jgi:hypothetical protein